MQFFFSHPVVYGMVRHTTIPNMRAEIISYDQKKEKKKERKKRILSQLFEDCIDSMYFGEGSSFMFY